MKIVIGMIQNIVSNVIGMELVSLVKEINFGTQIAQSLAMIIVQIMMNVKLMVFAIMNEIIVMII